MAPDVLKRASDPFFSTAENEKGRGLGLAIVHAVARRAGGHVAIDSAHGIGTRVQLRLPLIHSQVTD